MKMKEKSKGSDNSEDYSSDDNNMLDKQDSKKNKRKIEGSTSNTMFRGIIGLFSLFSIVHLHLF